MPHYERATVSFSRQANDSNYGSETVRVELHVVPNEGEQLTDEQVAEMLARARSQVHAELSKSPSGAVRRAVEVPPA